MGAAGPRGKQRKAADSSVQKEMLQADRPGEVEGAGVAMLQPAQTMRP